MDASGPWPVDIWDRIVRAYNDVQDRLTRSSAALDEARVPYAVIGAHAVAHWVEQADSGAMRNTPNVDLLVRPADLARASSVLETVGFVPVGQMDWHHEFLDGPTGRSRSALRLWLCGEVVKSNIEPLPDIASAVRATRFAVVPLETLVRMKLSAWRTIDKVHLRDMIDVGLIDATWPDRFPEVLAERLRNILANPDG